MKQVLRTTAAGLIFSLFLSAYPQAAKLVRYASFQRGRAIFHMVSADMSQERVSAETVHSKRLTSIAKLLGATKPAVAITGTFFAPDCQRPVADVLVDGNLVAQGQRGSVVAVDWFGQVRIFDSNFNQRLDWGNYRWALRGGVRLIAAGKVAPDPKSQHFRDRRIWGRAARTAVGIDKDRRLVLMATSSQVTLSEIGKAMLSRGVREAISLDGGSSTCLYYRGKYLIHPNRKLSNLFVIHERSPYGYPADGAVAAVRPAMIARRP